MDHRETRQRVAILGGGMAGLAAAMALTDSTVHGRFDVTVYQDGWLLGGKGASVRNRAAHDRIEEHGLHLWLGFYENAFRVIRECYTELGRPAGSPLATWEEAFHRHDHITLTERTAAGWRPWHLRLPENNRVPGDGDDMPAPADYIGLGVGHLMQFLGAWVDEHGAGILDGGIRASLAEVATFVGGGVNVVGLTIGVALGVASSQAVARLTDMPGPLPGIERALSALASRLRTRLADGHSIDDARRRLFVLLDFYATVLVGMIRDGVVTPDADFAALDDEEFRAWLRRHGASELTCTSAFLQGIYNLTFADRDGAGAGTFLLGTLRMCLAFRGAVFYKMQAGMGETGIAPLYTVLARRGVRFEFFHRVKHLALSADNQRIEQVVTGRQVRVKGGQPYAPLIDVGGLPCFPESPLWDQIEDGDMLASLRVQVDRLPSSWTDVETRVLQHGQDYDQVILAIPIAALPPLCTQLSARSPRFASMLEHVRTVPTLNVQVWLDRDLDGLGWRHPPTILGAYAEPFDTWADMTHVLPRESWGAHGPRHIAYLGGQYGDASMPLAVDDVDVEGAQIRASAMGMRWLARHAGQLWPGVSDAHGGLDWEVLHDDAGRHGADRLRGQHARANVDPSGRYVLSVPGSTKYRLAADESGFDNLVLAGDWVHTGLDAGCIEAATMAGLQAARAVSGFPARIAGEAPEIRRRFTHTAAPTRIQTTPCATPVAAIAVANGRAASGPRYLDRTEDMVLRPPFAFRGVTMDAFALAASGSALRTYVARTLNGPAAGHIRYAVAAPMVMMAAAFIDRVVSLDPAHRRYGGTSEVDVSLWMPLWCHEPGRPRRLVWHLPYLFVDSAAAAAAGREVYGFAKTVAQPTVARDVGGLRHLALDAPSIARFAPDSVLSSGRIIEVTTQSSPDGRVADMLGRIQLPGRIEARLARALREPVPMVFLKQFRAGAGDRACYQAIVEADAVAGSVRSLRPHLRRYHVAWGDFDSHPFEALGLARGGQNALFGISVQFDFTVTEGRERVVNGQRITPEETACETSRTPVFAA